MQVVQSRLIELLQLRANIARQSAEYVGIVLKHFCNGARDSTMAASSMGVGGPFLPL
jgi:hypothetical protein